MHVHDERLHGRLVLVVGGTDEEVIARAQHAAHLAEAGRQRVCVLLGRTPGLLGGARNLGAMLVGACQEEHVLAALAVVPRQNVGHDRGVRVAHMRVRIHVEDRCRDEEAAGHGGGSIAAASPPPARVQAVVRAIALRLRAAGIPWRLAGSAALLVRGLPVRPGDIDIEVAAADAVAAAHALGLPAPARQAGGGWSSDRTVGQVAGVGIDLSGGLVVTGPGGTLRAMDAPVEEHGGIPLLPIGESLARALVAESGPRRLKAIAALPDDPALRSRAIAYAESRAAASAAR